MASFQNMSAMNWRSMSDPGVAQPNTLSLVTVNGLLSLAFLAINAVLWQSVSGLCAPMFLGEFAFLLALNLISGKNFLLTAVSFFMLFFMGYPATFGVGGYWGSTESKTANFPLILATLFYVFICCGAYLSALQKPRAVRPSAQLKPQPLIAGTIFVLVSLILLAIFASNPSKMLDTRFAASYTFIASAGRISALDTFLSVDIPKSFAFANFFACLMMTRFRVVRVHILIIILTGAVYLLLNNVLSTPRQILITQFLALSLGLGFAAKRPRVLWGIVALGFFCVGPVIDYFSRTRFSVRDVVFMRGPEFDTYQNSATFVRFIEANGFLYGEHALRTVSFMLPRQLKMGNVDLALSVAQYGSYTQLNISLPVFNEFYADFGIASLAAFSILMGYALSRAQTSWSQRLAGSRPLGPLSLASLYVVAGIFPLMRGPWLGNLPFITFTFSALVIIMSSIKLATALGQGRRI